MGAIPGGIDTSNQPPMTVPLRHFVVGLGFLLAGTGLGAGLAVGAVPGLGRLAHVHLLLVGWVCLTIMGAMTQFVPVWSGVTLHSRRLANVQLVLVVAGLAGFTTALTLRATAWLAPFGAVMLAGFWTFVYNVGRTLWTVEDLDVTERHFAVALGFFVLLTGLGVFLALGHALSVFDSVGVPQTGVLGAHVTLAVFGAVLTTVYGALYQLGTMFTQTELHGIDRRLQRVEAVGHPVGVVLLAAGRLTRTAPVATVGGLLVVLAALAFGLVLARKLYEMQVDSTPMHTRYAVVTVALVAWAVSTAPAWLADPTAPGRLLGATGSGHLLVVGVVGFVVFGTLYHVVPFIVWVHRYSDRLGFEAVPMIDDLYDDRLAAIDGTLLTAGTVLLVGSEAVSVPRWVALAGGVLVTLGVAVFIVNMLSVLHRHGPHPLDRVLLGPFTPRGTGDRSEDPTSSKRSS